MPNSHPASISTEELLSECVFERTRRGGPGGQHRNKVESAIVVTHQPTGICGQASERRSQHANRDVAVQRLRLNLAVAIRTDASSEYLLPTDRWRERAKGGRLKVSVQHEDFAALLAEALDILAAREFDVPSAAAALGVSGSQLVKFIKSLPAAFAMLNMAREKRGLGKLR